MKRLTIIVTLCVGCHLAVGAQATFTQRLQQSKEGEGKVTVTQSKVIEDLVNGPKVTEAPTKTEVKATPSAVLKKEKDTVSVKPIVPPAPVKNDSTLTPDESRKKVIKGGYKMNGYRVQVYAGGNSRDARVKAERTGKEINALFPGTPVYVHFYSPRWICRMGNYRTYEEAHEVLSAVKKLGYSSAIIVKGKITVAYAPPTETP